MDFKRLSFMGLLFLMLVFPASASMVSFLILETGLNDEMASSQHSRIWEGGLMDAFYDAGFIVTNYPISRIEKKPERIINGSLADDFLEAQEGGADYFLLSFLEYQINGNVAIPIRITIRLYSIEDKRLLSEQEIPISAERNRNEEYQFAQNIGQVLISSMKDR
jgi:hypothetical protein